LTGVAHTEPARWTGEAGAVGGTFALADLEGLMLELGVTCGR